MNKEIRYASTKVPPKSNAKYVVRNRGEKSWFSDDGQIWYTTDKENGCWKVQIDLTGIEIRDPKTEIRINL